MNHNVSLQKDAHGFTDHVARAEMSVRVDSKGKQSNYKIMLYCKKMGTDSLIVLRVWKYLYESISKG